MNISTIIVLLIIATLFILAVRNIMKKGMACSCGSKDCKACGCCCHKKEGVV